jgi:hypothetical protein
MSRKPSPALIEPVEGFIRLVRAQRVIFDSDLARIYGVTTARLNQQVKRNLGRFPSDFVFQLTADELTGLMLQSATSKPGRGGRRQQRDTLYKAKALGRSKNRHAAVHHDVVLYPR